MKINILLVIVAFFINAVNASAQQSTDFFIQKNQSVKLNNAKLSGLGNSFSLKNSAANCGESAVALVPSAIPCNGASVTSIVFSNASRTIVSGTTNTPGVVYKYANAGTAPDGTVVDAIVTVMSYSNNQDSTPNAFADADLSDGTTGYDRNLQPSIGQGGNFISNSPWTGSIKYKIQFVEAGTFTPKILTVAATTIDNDGSAACGGTLKESVTYSSSLNQVLTTLSTQQTISNDKLTITGPATVQNGIGIGADFANAALYVNVSEFTWTYSFATSGNCSTANASEVRYGSLNLTCQITNFGRAFASVGLSGTVYNDSNGLTDSTVNGTGTGTPGEIQLYANLLDANDNVVSAATVAANGSYTFSSAFTGNYKIQISKNRGVESSPAPAAELPAGWTYTGENIGASAGNDGTVNGLLPVTIGSTSVDSANFGIQQRPVAFNNTAPTQSNFGGSTSVAVPPATFTATDTAPGTVTGIRITAFPNNIRTIEINGVEYTTFTFPSSGVIIPTNQSGNPTQKILIDPNDGAVTVQIPYVAIDNTGTESAAPATASVPFTVVPTAARGNISGKLYFNGNPLRNSLVVLSDGSLNSKEVTRTDADGNYIFSGKDVGKTYVVEPLSSKYAFSPSVKVVNLVENATETDFSSTLKNYHPKNDFDGDGKSDIAVFRPSAGTWYVLKSSDEQMSAFRFGVDSDVPVSADFDGDGKTDYAVFRPSEGNWYIWQSANETLRVENFGLSGDRPLPADFDGDGKADLNVYRAGTWFVRRSSDDGFEARNFGLASDIPIVEDFDGDGKTDFSVYRPSEGKWFTLSNSAGTFSARQFGLAEDTPLTGDFDGDGTADVAQFRSGIWYVLNSTTAFEAASFGLAEDKSIVADYDGDGRSDRAIYHSGMWQIKNSADQSVRSTKFGLSTDILIK